MATRAFESLECVTKVIQMFCDQSSGIIMSSSYHRDAIEERPDRISIMHGSNRAFSLVILLGGSIKITGPHGNNSQLGQGFMGIVSIGY